MTSSVLAASRAMLTSIWSMRTEMQDGGAAAPEATAIAPAEKLPAQSLGVPRKLIRSRSLKSAKAAARSLPKRLRLPGGSRVGAEAWGSGFAARLCFRSSTAL